MACSKFAKALWAEERSPDCKALPMAWKLLASCEKWVSAPVWLGSVVAVMLEMVLIWIVKVKQAFLSCHGFVIGGNEPGCSLNIS